MVLSITRRIEVPFYMEKKCVSFIWGPKIDKNCIYIYMHFFFEQRRQKSEIGKNALGLP